MWAFFSLQWEGFPLQLGEFFFTKKMKDFYLSWVGFPLPLSSTTNLNLFFFLVKIFTSSNCHFLHLPHIFSSSNSLPSYFSLQTKLVEVDFAALLYSCTTLFHSSDLLWVVLRLSHEFLLCAYVLIWKE